MQRDESMESKARAASKRNATDSGTDVTPSFTSSSAETDIWTRSYIRANYGAQYSPPIKIKSKV